MNYIYSLFWSFAGSDGKILSECPTSEKNKHFGIGATIFITAIAAVLSGTYAIRTLVESPFASITVGLFWGFIIFNIDRLMVSTLKKDKENNKWKETIKASPRILLAIVIAVVISKPVEVKILENQIEKQLAYDFTKDKKSLDSKNREASGILLIKEEMKEADSRLKDLNKEEQQILNEEPYKYADEKFNKCQDERKQIDSQITRKRNEIQQVRRNRNFLEFIDVIVDENGREYRLSEAPAGITIKEEKQVPVLTQNGRNRINEINREIGILRSQKPSCSNYEKERDNYLSQRRKEIAERKSTIQALQKKSEDDYLAVGKQLDTVKVKNDTILSKAGSDIFGKLIALENAKLTMSIQQDTLENGEVISFTKTESTMMSRISIAIMLFFFILELCPIFVKIIADRGPYDDILETEELRVKERQRLLQREAINNTNTEIEMLQEKNDNLKNSELDTNQELIDQIKNARLDIAKEVVEKWKRKQMEDLESNPEEFIDKVVQ